MYKSELILFRIVDDYFLEWCFIGISPGHCADQVDCITNDDGLEMMQLHRRLGFGRPSICRRIENIDWINATPTDQIAFAFVRHERGLVASGWLALGR